MRDEKATPTSALTEDRESAATKTSPRRINHVSAPFVSLPQLGTTDRIRTLEIKLQSSVKLLREEAEYRKSIQSRAISELSDRLDAMAKQVDLNRRELNAEIKGATAKESVRFDEIKKRLLSSNAEWSNLTGKIEKRIEDIAGDIGTMTGLFYERDEQIIKQFQQVERRFTAFESALHHLEKGGASVETVSENEDRRLKREKVVFDTLETMQSRLEELELTVERMEGQPLSEITAQITALRNGQIRLKEQLFNLEEERTSSVPPGSADSSRRSTPLPLARVKLESVNVPHAHFLENEPKTDTLTALRNSIEAFQSGEKKP